MITVYRDLILSHLLMYRNTMAIYDYLSVNIFAGGLILNGEETTTDTQDILTNKGEW